MVDVSEEPDVVSVLVPVPAEPEPIVEDPEPDVDPVKFLHSADDVWLLQYVVAREPQSFPCFFTLIQSVVVVLDIPVPTVSVVPVVVVEREVVPAESVLIPVESVDVPVVDVPVVDVPVPELYPELL